ncbi:MAG TPA: methyltransferase [Clostridiales bacterium]|nr:methyltransferase [Clostridiales bacterium]
MNSRNRLINALNHKEDKVPVDFSGTSVTGIHVSCVEQLREYYGLEKKPIKVWEPYQLLGYVDSDLMDAMGIDVIGISGKNNMFGIPNDNWKEWRLESGQTVLIAGGFNTTVDQDGNTYVYPEGDTSVAPSGKLPKGGYYFDSIIRQPDIDEDALDPEDNLEEFKLLSESNIKYFQGEAIKAHQTGKGVIANFGGTGIGDIALVPGPFLKNPKGIRDITEWYISTVTRQDYLHKLFERQTDIALENLKSLNKVLGEYIDVVFLCGTDFGTQQSTFCSADAFKELYMPYYKKMNNWIKQNTKWKTFKHSCGAIEPFISLFVESGFDILNPVQCSASGMDPQELKDKYGEQIIFWGGGIDTQQVLPFGSKEDVRRQVLGRLEIFAKNGGYVFNTIHNIQAKTPVENIVAMIDAVHKFNK